MSLVSVFVGRQLALGMDREGRARLGDRRPLALGMDGDALVSVVSLLSALLSVPPAQPARPPALQSPARPAQFSIFEENSTKNEGRRAETSRLGTRSSARATVRARDGEELGILLGLLCRSSRCLFRVNSLWAWIGRDALVSVTGRCCRRDAVVAVGTLLV